MTRIYKSGDFMILVFDPLPGNTRAHSVSLPISENGFKVLVKILSEQERSPFVPKQMATPPAPIQHMVDQWLKSNAIKKVSKTDAPSTLTIEDLDL